MKKLSVVSLLILAPTLVFADPDPYALHDLINLLLMLLSTSIVGSFSLAVFYFIKGKSWAFYMSGILALLLFAFASFLIAGDKDIVDKVENLLLIPSLLIFAILLIKKVKLNPSKVFWYYGLTTTLILLLFKLLHFIGTENSYFLLYLNYFIYALTCYFYVKRVVSITNIKANSALFLNTTLICSLSFLTIMFYFLAITVHWESIFEIALIDIGNYIKSFLIVLAVGNLATFLTIRYYPIKRKIE